jgi:hypothetical protein
MCPQQLTSFCVAMVIPARDAGLFRMQAEIQTMNNHYSTRNLPYLVYFSFLFKFFAPFRNAQM